MSEAEAERSELSDVALSPKTNVKPTSGFPPLSPELKINTQLHYDVVKTPTPSPKAKPPSPGSGSGSGSGKSSVPSYPIPLRHTDSDFSYQFTNTAPSGHRMITNPTLLQDAPINQVIMEKRDDESFDNNSGYNSANFSYHPPTPSSLTQSQDQQMDEILIQKYMAEKKKYRAAEANNARFQAHIHELSKQMEAMHLHLEREKSASNVKLQQQTKTIETFEQTVEEMKEKMKLQQEQTEQKLTLNREEGEKKVRMARDESEVKLISIRNEMMDVQKRYGASKSRLDQQINHVSELYERNKKMENELNEKRVHISAEIEKSTRLDEQLRQLQNSHQEVEDSNRAKDENMKEQVNQMQEKYDFEKQRAADFSGELKIMSYEYVKNLEELDALRTQNDKNVQELDRVTSELKEVTNKAARTNAELEEMAKGFLETESLLSKEGEMTSKLSVAVNALNVQLHNELTKSKALEGRLTILEKKDKNGQAEIAILKSSSKSLSEELSNYKEKIVTIVTNSTQLNKVLVQTKAKLSNTTSKLSKSQTSTKSLTEEVACLKETNASLQSELDETKSKFEPVQEYSKKVFQQLQEQSDSYVSLKEKSMLDTAEKENLLNVEMSKVKSLSINLEGLIKKCKVQDASIVELKQGINGRDETVTKLSTELEQLNESYVNVKQQLASEREDFAEKLAGEEERVVTISNELEELEKKHSDLFNNLVDTEEDLMNTKEELQMTMMRLETKDNEFKPVESMLQNEISIRDTSLKEEQEKNMKLTGQNVELNKKCNHMYAALVAVEEKFLGIDKEANELKNEAAAKDQECKNLAISLEKEKNGPHQRKIKVAKKMIQAEKNRYKALQKEIEAKNLMIKRLETQSIQHDEAAKRAQNELEEEKATRATHSRTTLQNMRKQLDEEKKSIKVERETLKEKLRVEKAQVKSLSMRLRVLEKSTGEEEVSNALKEHHEVQEQVRVLTGEKTALLKSLDGKVEAELKHEKQLSIVSNNLRDLTNYMETMATYCYNLEEEKKILKKEVESFNHNSASLSTTRNLFNLLEDEGDGSDADDESVGGMSLSDFSVAQIPNQRKVRLNMMSRTSILTSSIAKLLKSNEANEEIELTMDPSS
jgi:chromosome segregation ATPase